MESNKTDELVFNAIERIGNRKLRNTAERWRRQGHAGDYRDVAQMEGIAVIEGNAEELAVAFIEDCMRNFEEYNLNEEMKLRHDEYEEFPHREECEEPDLRFTGDGETHGEEYFELWVCETCHAEADRVYKEDRWLQLDEYEGGDAE